MREDKKILLMTILSGIFLWVAGALLDTLLLEGSFLNVLLFDVPPEKIAIRGFLFIYFLVMALMISWFLSKARRADERVQFFEQKYRRIFGTTKEGIIVLDAETGEVMDVNPFIEELLGYSDAELKHRNIWEISNFSDALAGPADLKELLSKKHINYHDLVLKTRGGNEVIVNFGCNLEVTGGKKVAQCNIMDVTKRRAAEEKLLLLSEIIEQCAEGIAATDMEGMIMFVNKAFAKLHGYEPEELIGKHLAVFHTPEQMPTVYEANRKLKEIGEFSGEIWHVRRNRTVFQTWMQNTLLRDELGRPIGIIATLMDLSQRNNPQDILSGGSESFNLGA